MSPIRENEPPQLRHSECLHQEVRDAESIPACTVLLDSTATPLFRQAANYTGRAVKPPHRPYLNGIGLPFKPAAGPRGQPLLVASAHRLQAISKQFPGRPLLGEEHGQHLAWAG